MRITRLTESLLEPAAGIAASRYREARAGMPLMPEAFAGPSCFVERMLSVIGKHPAAAILNDEGNLAAFIMGYRIADFKGSTGGVYIPEWGHGIDPALPAKLAEQAYCELATYMIHRWVDEGCLTFAASVYPGNTRLRELLFWNEYGLHVIDAMRDVNPPDGTPAAHDAVSIVRADSSNLEHVMPLSDALWKYLAGPPVYLYPEDREGESAMGRWLNSSGHILWLAWKDDRAVGFIRCEPPTPTGSFIATAPGTVAITGMYVEPEFRKMGIGIALLAALTAYAKASGITRIAVDFESRNVLARRFWLRHFQPVSYSLIRRIDDRFLPK